jgi:hypothetical protein
MAEPPAPDDTLVPDEDKLDEAMNAVAKAVSDALRESPLATRLQTLPRFVIVVAFPFHGLPGPVAIRSIGNVKRPDIAKQILEGGAQQIHEGPALKIYGPGL